MDHYKTIQQPTMYETAFIMITVRWTPFLYLVTGIGHVYA